MRRQRTLAAVSVAAVALVGASADSAAKTGGARSPLRWSAPRLVDHTAPFGRLVTISGTACPTATVCLGVGTSGTVVSHTAAGNRVTTGVDGGAQLQDVSCPSSSLCVAIGETDLLVSHDPTAPRPRWRRVHPKLGQLEYDGITCPTTRLCVAWLDSDTLRVSTDPAGGASTWHRVTMPLRGGDIYSVGCARGSTVCVASMTARGPQARFVTTTDAAGGTGAWHVSQAPRTFPPDQMACPSTALCVGIGNDHASEASTIETTTDPAGGASTWRRSRVRLRPKASVAALDCATASDCVVALDDGSVATTTGAGGGGSTYTQSGVIGHNTLRGLSVNAMACPTTSSCVVPANSAGLTAVDVGPPASASTARDLAGFTVVTGLACPSASLCVGLDGAGAILRAMRPAGPAGGWQRTVQPRRPALNSVSCPSVGFCAAAGDSDTVLTTGSPGGSAPWQRTRLKQTYEIDSQDPPGPFPYNLESISCPSRRLCVAGTDVWGVMVSTHPTAGPSAWHYRQLTAGNVNGFYAVSCPTTSLCVAGDEAYGQIEVATRPAAGANAWHATKLVPHAGFNDPITALSCPSARFCLVGDGRGVVYSSTHPTRGRRAWRRVRLGGGEIVAASCRSGRFCVVIDDRHAYASRHPGGPRRDWRPVTLPTGRFPLSSPSQEQLWALACAPGKLCLAANGIGAVFPAAG